MLCTPSCIFTNPAISLALTTFGELALEIRLLFTRPFLTVRHTWAGHETSLSVFSTIVGPNPRVGPSKNSISYTLSLPLLTSSLVGLLCFYTAPLCLSLVGLVK